jgi:hypothetical protein
MINYMLITNQAQIASYAINAGVHRIFVDLEIIGKQERQGGLDTLISKHNIEDVAKVRAAIPTGNLLVRINPIHANTANEVEAVIAAGADLIMLPMFRTADDVAQLARLVAGRAGIVPLIETPEAMHNLAQITQVNGVTEIYIGFNDLHLALGLDFMFEFISNGMLQQMVSTIRAAGLPFGFGGIARLDEGLVPGRLIIAEHVKHGSSSVILSRTFHRQATDLQDLQAKVDLPHEVALLRQFEQSCEQYSGEDFQNIHNELCTGIESIVKSKQQAKASHEALN